MADAAIKASPRVSIKSVALPAEHGGWGFLFEPILLGLLVAPSIGGLWLGIAALAVFLIHQPLKITLKDRIKGKRYARTMMAERFTFGYSLLALTAFVFAHISSQHPFWLPLLFGVPFAFVQVFYEMHNEGRQMLPEVTGALALGVVAPAIVLMSGWALPEAILLWGLLALRATSSILYVRSRLRLEYGRHAQIPSTLIAHLVSLTIVIGGFLIGWTTLWPVIGFVILFGRAAIGLSSFRKSRKPRSIGFAEIAYGLMSVILFSI